jgi:hypothetical protein
MRLRKVAAETDGNEQRTSHTAWDEKWVQLQELVHRLAFGRLRGKDHIGHAGESKRCVPDLSTDTTFLTHICSFK